MSAWEITTVTFSIKKLILDRLKARASSVELDLTNDVINKALEDKVWEYLGMKHDWGNLGPYYDAKSKGAETLVMPIIRAQMKEFVEKACSKPKTLKKLLEKCAAEAIGQNYDRRGYGMAPWVDLVESQTKDKCSKVADEVLRDLAYKMAAEDAKVIYDQGVEKALEKLTHKGVLSEHERMACRSDDTGESGKASQRGRSFHI